ncbi:MAG: histidine phosphatase family protein [Alphaproteobacteria bacterium]
MTDLPTTRWWWVRHAPAFCIGGAIYGSSDVECDTSDDLSFRGLAARLPEDALWVTSHLTRTRETAAAIFDGGAASTTPLIEKGLGEQCFGEWQGQTHDDLARENTPAYHKFWLAPARHVPPGGESFTDVMVRVDAVIKRLTEAHAGRDIVAVAHGGSIRAALALALGVDANADAGLCFTVDNLSITQIDHVPGPGAGGNWRIVSVNQSPV